MSHNHDSLRERTLNNENLAGPEPYLNGVETHRCTVHNGILNNENLAAPTPRVDDAPLEKDFSQNGSSSYPFSSDLYVTHTTPQCLLSHIS